MIEDSIKAFDEIKGKYNLVSKRTTIFGFNLDTWTFPDALNAKGFAIGYKLGLRFADKCFYDSEDDDIKFIGVVTVEPSNYEYKIKSLREMFDIAKLKMKQYRMKNKIKDIEKDFT